MYDVTLTQRATRHLRRIRGRDLGRIVSAMTSLENDPRPRGVTHLVGDTHRIRVGDWRVIYKVTDAESEVVVTDILRRNERTYRNI